MEYLAAMAVMKVNFDQKSADVLQTLVPFVADCARTQGAGISDARVQQDLQERYGLPVPRTVVKTLLSRLAKAGALRRQDGVYETVEATISAPQYDLSIAVAGVQRAQKSLLREGVVFARDVFGIELEEAQLGEALAALVQKEVVPLSAWAISRDSVVFSDAEENDLEPVAAQFVLSVIDGGSDDARTGLEQIAKGALLSGTLWSSDLNAPDRRIKGLSLYLDTTLLLRLLGLCGSARKMFSQELVELAKVSGVDLFCFEHNRAEILGVLSAAQQIFRTNRSDYYGEALEFMASEGWGASDVEEVIANLDELLLSAGVAVRRRPNREARYNMDEVELRKLLDDVVKYTNVRALDADVDSLASIFVLRKAQQVHQMEKARAAFVTTNFNLVRGASRLYRIGEVDAKGIPLALIESQVASFLWARNPSRVGDLPLNLLAVGALSVAESDPRIWLRYVSKLDELRGREKISDQDYAVLRQSLLARSVLMAVTNGDAEAFTEDTAEFVLKHAIAERERALRTEIEAKDAELVKVRTDLAVEREAGQADRDKRHGHLRARAENRARALVVLGAVFISLMTGGAALIAFPWPTGSPLSDHVPDVILWLLGGVAVLSALASVLIGFSIKEFGGRFVAAIADRFEKGYRRRLGMND